MAKIRVKLRPSSIEGKPGTIYYCVSHKRMVRHITTNIHLQPSLWDESAQRILPEAPDAGRMQNRINSDMSVLCGILRELELRQRDFTTDDIIDRFRAPERHISVVSFLYEQIEFLTDCNRLGTAMNYRRAASALTTYLGSRDLSFHELTSQFVEQYNDYLLRRGMVRNSLSFHMRILRAAYNKAVRHGYAEQTFPFRDVYTGIDRTRKRAVSEGVISRLMALDIGHNPPLSFSRDMFLFSFFTRGMAFVDMAYLRKSDICDGVIRYARHKTGQVLVVRIEPCMQAIIDRYADSGTPYVFPILKSENPAECFRRYKTGLRIYNARLLQLSELLGLEQHLSSYTSRHSWATMARNHNVPLSVISAGMGHTSERTTQIYLTSLESSLIDRANRSLLDKFNSPISESCSC